MFDLLSNRCFHMFSDNLNVSWPSGPKCPRMLHQGSDMEEEVLGDIVASWRDREREALGPSILDRRYKVGPCGSHGPQEF